MPQLKPLTLVAPLILLATIAIVLWSREEATAPALALECPAPAQGCGATVAMKPVQVRLDGPLRTLKPFQVRVDAPGFDQIEANFTMPGMNMGFNRYTLKRDATGHHHVQVLLPTCISGRGDWVMTLEFDGRERLALPVVLAN